MEIKDQGCLIRESDWEVIVLLDACRWDVFEQVNYLPGNLQKVNSGAFNTSTWYKNHWNKDTAKNTVLISAQPMAFWIKAHKVFDNAILVKADDSSWMHPRLTIDKALEMDGINQRLLVHLIPPHLPYQGQKGKKFLDRIGASKEGEELWDVKFGENNIQKRVENYGRKHDWDELKEYYKENIEFALPEVETYIRHTTRKVIVTSDHGDLIGEDNLYGHSQYRPLLTEVPWLEII